MPDFYKLFCTNATWTSADAKASYMPARAPNKYMVIGETAAMWNLCDVNKNNKNCDGTYGPNPPELDM